ncbi:MAG: hypothetical protein H6815_06785 [Phycisphaeraceae bacterium]|nr:hypothetical protein [Phycisphaerales bacterium]MCB9860144.1 hypothetical protein [Phycisphaeraceae bacterium]
MTPPIPNWIKYKHIPGYTNIYSLQPNETRIFGTESLYGDWNGRVLLMAKDFACSKLIRDRIAEGDPRPFRHEPSLRTNTRLRKCADCIATGARPEACGILYGSVLAGMLRDDDSMSGTLPSRKLALDYGSRIVSFVRSSMPNLQVVACMGEDSWLAATKSFDITLCWKEASRATTPTFAKNTYVIAVHHPARASNEKMIRAWDLVSQTLSASGTFPSKEQRRA